MISRQSWGSLGGLLGRLGAVLEASWPVLERREAKKARRQKHIENHNGKSMILASRGPLGRPLGGFSERLGGLLARLGAILGVLERSFGVSGPSWAVLEASWGLLGPSLGPLGPGKAP